MCHRAQARGGTGNLDGNARCRYEDAVDTLITVTEGDCSGKVAQ